MHGVLWFLQRMINFCSNRKRFMVQTALPWKWHSNRPRDDMGWNGQLYCETNMLKKSLLLILFWENLNKKWNLVKVVINSYLTTTQTLINPAVLSFGLRFGKIKLPFKSLFHTYEDFILLNRSAPALILKRNPTKNGGSGSNNLIFSYYFEYPHVTSY